MNHAALSNIGYGLYVLTTKTDSKDNGCIINTVMQITGVPPHKCIIAVNKQNHTHDMLIKSKNFNISILTTETPFKLFEHFGFNSGATIDKFIDYKNIARSKNGIIYLPEYANAFLSFEVTDFFDFGSHTMFNADPTDGEIIGNAESLTYAYYQQHIKPQPSVKQNNGFRCIICNYIYEGNDLPATFICPLCKHGANDFIQL